ISTVDHVETLPGQVAMVMVLEGRVGNYGSGKEATRLIPAPAGP
ncbi:MAG: copper transporter, partial [Actinobacteria bacterium]|nr:copper transporter [Actinomycetota bacterium]